MSILTQISREPRRTRVFTLAISIGVIIGAWTFINDARYLTQEICMRAGEIYFDGPQDKERQAEILRHIDAYFGQSNTRQKLDTASVRFTQDDKVVSFAFQGPCRDYYTEVQILRRLRPTFCLSAMYGEATIIRRWRP